MTVDSNHTLLVIGHHHPDTDAVCSALAYASFYRWQTGQDAVACYLDDLAPETMWLLRPDQTLREAGQLMQMHQVRALPVVDDANRLLGLVQRDTLAARYLELLQLPEEIDLPVELIQRTLEAELLAGSAVAVLNNRVWIATMTAATARATIGAGEVVIVGDQLEVQQAALEAGASCLIVTDSAPLNDIVVAA